MYTDLTFSSYVDFQGLKDREFFNVLTGMIIYGWDFLNTK